MVLLIDLPTLSCPNRLYIRGKSPVKSKTSSARQRDYESDIMYNYICIFIFVNKFVVKFAFYSDIRSACHLEFESLFVCPSGPRPGRDFFCRVFGIGFQSSMGVRNRFENETDFFAWIIQTKSTIVRTFFDGTGPYLA